MCRKHVRATRGRVLPFAKYPEKRAARVLFWRAPICRLSFPAGMYVIVRARVSEDRAIYPKTIQDDTGWRGRANARAAEEFGGIFRGRVFTTSRRDLLEIAK